MVETDPMSHGRVSIILRGFVQAETKLRQGECFLLLKWHENPILEEGVHTVGKINLLGGYIAMPIQIKGSSWPHIRRKPNAGECFGYKLGQGHVTL